jgi:hypothetical protein
MTKTINRASDKRQAEIIDAATGKPEGTPRRIDLSNLRDVRLELAAVYRKMDAGEIESQDGTRRAYVLKTVHDVIVSAELERRIQELEERQVLPGEQPRLPYQAAH